MAKQTGMVEPNKTILGAAGEHFVMCQLLRRGLIAALAPTGVPNADIVVTDEIGDRLCAVQVKVRRDIGSDGGWHMGKSMKKFVPRTSSTASWISGNLSRTLVPSAVVADVLKKSHRTWLETPGKNNRQHRDSKVRRFTPSYEKLLGEKYKTGWLNQYYEGWSRLEAVAKEA